MEGFSEKTRILGSGDNANDDNKRSNQGDSKEFNGDLTGVLDSGKLNEALFKDARFKEVKDYDAFYQKAEAYKNVGRLDTLQEELMSHEEQGFLQKYKQHQEADRQNQEALRAANAQRRAAAEQARIDQIQTNLKNLPNPDHKAIMWNPGQNPNQPAVVRPDTRVSNSERTRIFSDEEIATARRYAMPNTSPQKPTTPKKPGLWDRAKNLFG